MTEFPPGMLLDTLKLTRTFVSVTDMNNDHG